MKKLIAYLMVFTLIFSTIPTSIFAEGSQVETDKTQVNNVEPVAPTNLFISNNDYNYLIKFKDNEGKEKVKDKITKNGGKINKEFRKLNAIQAKLDADALTELKNDPDIDLIEPDVKVKMSSEDIPWGIERINATEAQGTGARGQGVNLAVFDTGIAEHNDLSVAGGISFVSDNPSFLDDNGHGTHVAGTIAALLNDEGIAGVAPSVNLFAVKVLKSDGTGSYSSIIEAIEWAIDNNIQVINMSFGGSQYSEILEDAINLANSNNILVFAAAGNTGKGSGDSILYPAKYENVVAVGAIDQSGKRAEFSSIGPDLELMAPGVNIKSTLANGSYGTMSGTSMASPHAAGLAALLWSKDLTVSNTAIRGLMDYSATELGKSDFYGNGVIDAARALKLYNDYMAFEKAKNGEPGNDTKIKKDVFKKEKKDTKKHEQPDDTNGTIEDYVLESPHPYSDNYNNTWRVSKPEASSIRVHFAYIETEANYDHVKTSSGDSWSGSYSDGVWSSWSNGSYVDVTLTTDGSTTGTGFYIDKIEYVDSGIAAISGTVASYILASPSPYPNSYSNTWTVSKTGAATIRVHFSWIDVEAEYDNVTTSSGSAWSGTYSNVWSSWAMGSSMNVTLNSDSSVTGKGFYIDQIEYTTSSGTTETITVGTTKYISGVTSKTYKLSITTAGTYNISTGNYSRDCDTYLELYDAYNTLIDENDDANGAYSTIERKLSAGTYYIKVRNYAAGTAVYCSLLVKLVPPPESIAVGTTKIINNLTEKWYTLVISTKATYQIATSLYGSEYDTCLELYDSTKTNLLESNDDNGVDLYSTIQRALAPGTYYIKVFSYDSGTPFSCKVSVLNAANLIPTVTLDSPTSGRTYNVGQTVNISATGTNCHHMAAFINGTYMAGSYSLGNILSYGYTPSTPGTYSIYVAGRNTEGETDPGTQLRQSATVTVTFVQPKPDLIVTDISWSPSSPVAGNAVTFSATIKNQGSTATPAGAHRVGFSIDGGATTIWSNNYTSSIPAGSSVTVTANAGSSGATWLAAAGSHTIRATVDDLNTISEGSETNNSYSETLAIAGLPDLIVTNITMDPSSPYGGDEVTFSATIKNNGTSATPAGIMHRVGFKVDGSSTIVWSSNYTSSIPVGSSVAVTANGGVNGATWTAVDGSHTVTALVDEPGYINESNESNNSFSKSITVNVASLDPGEEYLDNLAAELQVTSSGNSVTFMDKTFICDSTNSRSVNGRIAVDTAQFAQFFVSLDVIDSRLFALTPGGTGSDAICSLEKPEDSIITDLTNVTAEDIGSDLEAAAYGQYSENVKNIQLALQKLGYWVDPQVKATGLFGEVTRLSLIKYEKEDLMMTDSEISYINGNEDADIVLAGEIQVSAYDASYDGVHLFVAGKLSEEANGRKITALTLAGNFFLGMGDAVVETAKGTWQMVRHPIRTGEGIIFLCNASKPGTRENILFSYITANTMIECWNDFSEGDANLRARYIGRIVGEIVLVVVGTKGTTLAFDAIKASAETGRLGVWLGRIGRAEAVADDAVALLDGAVDAKEVIVEAEQVAVKTTKWYDISKYYDDIVQSIRTSTGLTSPTRNMAYLEAEFDGVASQLKAYSSTADIEGFVKLETDASKRLFNTIEVSGYDRYVDTEAKALEQVAKDLGAIRNTDDTINWGNTLAEGTINLYTELEPCPSCYSVIEQFRQHFPNIKVNIYWTTNY